MANFNIDKKGYNQEEVDDYINKLYLKYEEKLRQQKDRVSALRNEVETLNARLANYVDKDEQISKALLYAVEKADQIENNAKNVYNMEIKRINALYSRWEDLLLEVEKTCPGVNQNRYINSLMEDFKASITEVSKTGLTLNTKSIKEDLKNNSDQFIRNILNRMDYVVNSAPQNVVVQKRTKTTAPRVTVTPKTPESKPTPVKTTTRTKTTTVKSENKQSNEQPKSYSSISSINERLKRLNLISRTSPVPSVKKNESLADKFLNSDEDIKLNAYSKNFTKKKLEKNNPFMFVEYPEPNESGFDLKDALNPKEDLDEIMKSFDFFDGDENPKKKK